MKRSLFSAALAATMSIQAAGACVTVTVYNESEKDVDVVWMALGCAGVYDSFITVCAHHKMPANSGPVSHNYDFGKTIQTVTFHYPVEVDGKHKWVRSDYGYIRRHGYRKIKTVSTSPGSCGKHYHIHYTNDDVSRDVEDAYSVHWDTTDMDSMS